jgi:hypothetical protein
MAKPIRSKEARRRRTGDFRLPIGRENVIILGVGILLIVLGYAAMLEGSVEGFLPLVAAPILLVLGYCVVVPIAILYRRRGAEKKSDSA